MKIFAVFALFCVAVVSAEMHCQHRTPDIPKDWLDMVDPCVKSMRGQIQEELKAAMQYMAMGAHFAKDSVNRLGFAKMFFESASEEREHAIKLIHYLLMRGELTSNVKTLIEKNLQPSVITWANGTAALKDALRLEASVTRKIRGVIEVCESNKENYNDYHLVDYLTGDFLEEQYHGQREIAGRISVLEKMTKDHGVLGEYLYDRKLLE